MKPKKLADPVDAPQISQHQIDELKSRLAAARGEPLYPVGTESVCPRCGGKMITTNDLEELIVTPGLAIIVTRLPGAKCVSCGDELIDGVAAAALYSRFSSRLLADYETSVTRASGKTLGTYFKMDLVRVLGLTGNEQLFWKVVDRDRVFVEVSRTPWKQRSRSIEHEPRRRSARAKRSLRSHSKPYQEVVTA
jgi:YgiT-type zinc finger domain-containing protein